VPSWEEADCDNTSHLHGDQLNSFNTQGKGLIIGNFLTSKTDSTETSAVRSIDTDAVIGCVADNVMDQLTQYKCHMVLIMGDRQTGWFR
jgi:hypothetical protein